MKQEFLKIIHVEHCYLENTSTNPFVGTLENNEKVVIKYPNNLNGNLVLINEYLSALIADALGLKIPRFGLCILDESTVFSDELSDLKNHNNYGICFYSEYIKYFVKITKDMFEIILNKNQFARLVLFDHIIFNKDRHEGNIGVSGKDFYMYIIDHSHVFKNQTIWNKFDFTNEKAEYDIKDTSILKYNNSYDVFFDNNILTHLDLINECEFIKTILTEDKIDELFKYIPKEWESYLEYQDDLIYLKKYINYRIKNLEKICGMISERKGLKYEQNCLLSF